MTLRIDRNINFYNELTNDPSVSVNASGWTMILDAATIVPGVPPRRMGYKVVNLDRRATVYIVEGDEPVDLQDRGFPVYRRSAYFSKPDNVHMGQVWAKTSSGTADVIVIDENGE